MLREYSHTKSECLVQIRTAMAEIQHFFSRGLFFYWRTLYMPAISSLMGRDLPRVTLRSAAVSACFTELGVLRRRNSRLSMQSSTHLPE